MKKRTFIPRTGASCPVSLSAYVVYRTASNRKLIHMPMLAGSLDCGTANKTIGRIFDYAVIELSAIGKLAVQHTVMI